MHRKSCLIMYYASLLFTPVLMNITIQKNTYQRNRIAHMLAEYGTSKRELCMAKGGYFKVFS